VKRSRWAVLSLLTAAHALSAAAALAVAPLAPVLLDALDLTRAQVGLFVPAIYLGGVLMSMPAGWITDRLGVRATLAAGLLLEALMIALAGAAPRFAVLLACLFGADVGFSVVNPTTGKAIIERFPVRGRGFAMGIKQTGLTLGGMLAAFTLPAVALRWGWQAAFTVAGACAALGALAGLMSGRLFGGRRRPCLIFNASAGAFGWTGLYLALAAEVGGTRYAGLLTGVAVTCAWSGILVGPTLFGAALETLGSYRWPWLALTCSGAAVAVVLSRIAPLAKRA